MRSYVKPSILFSKGATNLMANKKLRGIYKIVNTFNNKVYIGSSVDIESRHQEHKRDLRNGKHHNYLLQRDWDKYGEESFEFVTISTHDTKCKLSVLEFETIEKYKKHHTIYNISNPLEEPSRRNDRRVNKGKNTKGVVYKYTQSYVLRCLTEELFDKARSLHSNIGKRFYFLKSDVDKWMMNSLQNSEITTDDRLPGLLNRWYNQVGFAILESSAYKRQLTKLGVSVPMFKNILVPKDFVSVLISMKKDPSWIPRKPKGLTPIQLDALQHTLLDYKHVKLRDKISICCDFFSKEMTKAKEQISERKYYNKDSFDAYFKDKIKRRNIIMDCDIDKVLRKMYSEFGFRAFKRISYEHIFDLLGINDPECKTIIANEQVLEQLHIYPSVAHLSTSSSI